MEAASIVKTKELCKQYEGQGTMEIALNEHSRDVVVKFRNGKKTLKVLRFNKLSNNHFVQWQILVTNLNHPKPALSAEQVNPIHTTSKLENPVEATSLTT